MKQWVRLFLQMLFKPKAFYQQVEVRWATALESFAYITLILILMPYPLLPVYYVKRFILWFGYNAVLALVYGFIGFILGNDKISTNKILLSIPFTYAPLLALALLIPFVIFFYIYAVAFTILGIMIHQWFILQVNVRTNKVATTFLLIITQTAGIVAVNEIYKFLFLHMFVW